jgi:hypothetical protein
MLEYVIAILIFLAVMTVTAVIFCLWMVIVAGRLIFRGIGGIFGIFGRFGSIPAPRLPMQMGGRGVTCQNPQCHALNTESARFCRRCGKELPEIQRVSAKRVAAL